MAVTLRILHLGTEPLDGVTELPPNPTIVQDPVLNIGVITLAPGVRFGALDPGKIPYLAGQPSSLILRSSTIYSRVGADGLGSHNGCPILISGPATTGGFQAPAKSRTLAIMGPGGAPPPGNAFTQAGIIPLFPPVPIPPAHLLRFDTTPDGVAPGPHLIQLTFEVARLCPEIWEAQPCCPPGTENCPVLTSYEGPASVDIGDPPFNAILRGFYFRPGDIVEFRPQGPGNPLAIGTTNVVTTTQIDLSNIDPFSAGTPDTYDVAVVRQGCPDTILTGVLTITGP